MYRRHLPSGCKGALPAEHTAGPLRDRVVRGVPAALYRDQRALPGGRARRRRRHHSPPRRPGGGPLAPAGAAPAWPDEPSGSLPGSELAELMAVQVGETGGAATSLMQLDDPVLNSSVGAVHGGVSSMGLELVASAAVSRHSADAGFRTASLQVNFLPPFHGGRRSPRPRDAAARRSPQRRGGDTAGRGRWQGGHGGPADCLLLRGE